MTMISDVVKILEMDIKGKTEYAQAIENALFAINSSISFEEARDFLIAFLREIENKKKENINLLKKEINSLLFDYFYNLLCKYEIDDEAEIQALEITNALEQELLNLKNLDETKTCYLCIIIEQSAKIKELEQIIKEQEELHQQRINSIIRFVRGEENEK